MKLVIISGRSGSGKSTALNVLEDVGYYCIDNLPAALLPALVEQAITTQTPEYQNVAVCIDARNTVSEFNALPALLDGLPDNVKTDVLFFDASSPSLIKRFSETRRKHPLSSQDTVLREAIQREKVLLEPLANRADLRINTTDMSVHELRNIMRKRLVSRPSKAGMALLLMSFGYKRGVPIDADFVFDVRCLPNPYWVPELRGYTGQEQPVQNFLNEQTEVQRMIDSIDNFLQDWLQDFAANDRTYMTVAIGCTGGYHRSVYISEQLEKRYQSRFENLQVHHRELSRINQSDH